MNFIVKNKKGDVHLFVDMYEAMVFIKWKRETKPEDDYKLYELYEIFNTTDLGR